MSYHRDPPLREDDEQARLAELTFLGPGSELPTDKEVWKQAEAMRLARTPVANSKHRDFAVEPPVTVTIVHYYAEPEEGDP